MGRVSLKDLKQGGYLAVDFYLTKSCNRSCWYCTSWTKQMRNLNTDFDFLKKAIEYLSPYKTRICLLGGEPALVHNLPEIIAEIKKHDNLIPQVMSNSLIRNRYPWILDDPDIFYMEHLVLDFHEDRIEKLGNHDFLAENDSNNYNIIIKTPNYYKYRENHDLSAIDHKNTDFKEYNGRSEHFDRAEQDPEIARRICAQFPMVPVIDFELQQIRHCSRKTVNGSKTFDMTRENIDKMMNFDLFKFEEYCKTCTEIIPKRPDWQKRAILAKIGEQS